MHLHGDRVQARQHHDGAEHSLGGDTRNQCGREPQEIASTRTSEPRTQRGKHHGEADHEREQPVDLLDRGMV